MVGNFDILTRNKTNKKIYVLTGMKKKKNVIFQFPCFSPDVERDGDHRVEDDHIGPEGEEGREQEVVHRWIPGQVALKQRSHLSLPHGVTHRQDHTHTHQEPEDLRQTEQRHAW